jgi:two-component system, cell cycle sensor histidine kinase and response regulator CckA
MVEHLGYQALVAADGQEAVSLYEQQASAVDCVLLDLTMPQLDGVATFEALKAINPRVKAILCSGFGEQTARARFGRQELAGFLQKPYQLQAIESILSQVLADRKGDSSGQ